MKPIFWSNRDGAAAVEFALVVPALLLMVGSILGLGLAFWTKNALQQAATETARCLAINSPICSQVMGACASSTPAVCYLERVAAQRGVVGVIANQVTIDRLASVSGASFTTVTVNYPVAFFGYELVLHATGHFPNPDPS